MSERTPAQQEQKRKKRKRWKMNRRARDQEAALRKHQQIKQLNEYCLRSCEGKVQYSSRAAAEARVRNSKDWDAYLCIFCGKWHIGHTKKPAPPS